MLRQALRPVLALGILLGMGCAAKQRVALDCVPNEVTVYVDGRPLRGPLDSVELSPDRAHTVFFKGGDHEPQMVVLEPREVEGTLTLEPSDLCSHTDFVPMVPEVKVQVEDPPE